MVVLVQRGTIVLRARKTQNSALTQALGQV